MIKYFIYCRKSTEEEERQALSIEAQLQELRDFARLHGLEVIREYTESKTAKKPGREIFNQMLEAMEKGVASGILAWHPDRLARNSIDGGKVVYLVDTGVIAALKFPTFWFEPTPQGKFMLQMGFGQAKYYIDNLRENILRGVRQKLRRGEYPLKAPLGYFNDPRKRTIVPHPEHFASLKKCLELFATRSVSLTDLQRKMFSLGLVGERSRKPLSLGSIGSVVRNPFYYGVFSYAGERYQGAHEPMITKQLFDQIQSVLRRKNRKNEDKGFLFLGLARCNECGFGITGERHTKRSGLVFVYYRCTGKSKVKHDTQSSYLRGEEFAKQIVGEVEKAALSDAWRDRFLAKTEKWRKETDLTTTRIVEELETEYKDINGKLDRLLDLHLDGTLDAPEYRERKNVYVERKVAIEQKLTALRRQSHHWLELTRQWILDANQAMHWVEEENFPALKNFLLENGSNQKVENRKFSTFWKSPCDFLPSARRRASELDSDRANFDEGALMWRWTESNRRAKRANR